MGFEANFAQHLAAAFDVLSETVTYTPPGGSAASVSGIMLFSQGDSGSYHAGVNGPLMAFDVQITEIANPEEGAVIVWNSTNYRVTHFELADDRHTHRLFVKETT